MFPTFRPDNAMKVEHPENFAKYVEKLALVSGIPITDYASFLLALRQRHDHFDRLGCRASDHGLEEPYGEECSDVQAARIFSETRSGITPGLEDQRKFKSALMHQFALMNHEKGWVFQMHIGAVRNNNTRKFRELGPDTGFDSIGDFQMAKPLIRFLDRLDQSNQLPRTILYNLNSNHNEVLASMIGTFMGDGIPGKIQHGPGWWFHDQKEGMEVQLQTLSNMGLLSQFVGMVTDSRSFLSFPRHEYYRRILCNMIGTDMKNGIVPNDYALMGELIVKLCYTNALQYFSFNRLRNHHA
jgi:glucuronate isomerase